MNKPRFYTYEEWINRHPEMAEEDECPDCEGTGQTECPECGSEVECERCRGTGDTDRSKEIYIELKKQEEVDWLKWAGNNRPVVKPEDVSLR